MYYNDDDETIGVVVYVSDGEETHYPDTCNYALLKQDNGTIILQIYKIEDRSVIAMYNWNNIIGVEGTI